MAINIDQYSSTDFDDVNRLILELQQYEHLFDINKSLHPEKITIYQNELLENVRKMTGEILIAKDNEKSQGLIAWYLEEEPEFDITLAYISDLIVSKDYRNKGIGGQLLDEALAHIKNKGIKRVHIGVLVSNEMTKDFYTKYGFKEYVLEMALELP